MVFLIPEFWILVADLYEIAEKYPPDFVWWLKSKKRGFPCHVRNREEDGFFSVYLEVRIIVLWS